MSTTEDSALPESRANPPTQPSPRYFTAILLTALVALLLGILVTHGIMVSKIADAPQQLEESLGSLHSDLSNINSQLEFVASAIRAGSPTVLTITPAIGATFTMSTARF
jgi:hypothetical protein